MPRRARGQEQGPVPATRFTFVIWKQHVVNLYGPEESETMSMAQFFTDWFLYDHLFSLSIEVIGFAAQLESTGSDGGEHIQGYIEFKQPFVILQLLKAAEEGTGMFFASWQVAKKNRLACTRYCTKARTQVSPDYSVARFPDDEVAEPVARRARSEASSHARNEWLDDQASGGSDEEDDDVDYDQIARQGFVLRATVNEPASFFGVKVPSNNCEMFVDEAQRLQVTGVITGVYLAHTDNESYAIYNFGVKTRCRHSAPAIRDVVCLGEQIEPIGADIFANQKPPGYDPPDEPAKTAKQRQEEDFRQMIKMLDEGKEVRDVVAAYPMLALKHLNQLIAYEKKCVDNDKPLPRHVPQILVIIGSTGTGKTSILRKLQNDFEAIKMRCWWHSCNTHTFYWDGIDPKHKVIFFDEVPIGWSFGITDLLTLLSDSPMSIATRFKLSGAPGGKRNWLGQIEQIVFTSNHPPTQWFPNAPAANIKALMSRIEAPYQRKILRLNGTNYRQEGGVPLNLARSRISVSDMGIIQFDSTIDEPEEELDVEENNDSNE